MSQIVERRTGLVGGGPSVGSVQAAFDGLRHRSALRTRDAEIKAAETDQETRLGVWARLIEYGGTAFANALNAIVDAELDTLPCRPILWPASRSGWLSDTQLDYIWLSWFVLDKNVPSGAGERPNALSNAELGARVARAVFPATDAYPDRADTVVYRCTRANRTTLAGIAPVAPNAKLSILPYSQNMNDFLAILQSTGADSPNTTVRALGQAAERAMRLRLDPLAARLEALVGKHNVWEDFFAASFAQRVQMLQRLETSGERYSIVPIPFAPPVRHTGAKSDHLTGVTFRPGSGAPRALLDTVSVIDAVVQMRSVLRAFHEGTDPPRLPGCSWGALSAAVAEDRLYESMLINNPAMQPALRHEASLFVVSSGADAGNKRDLRNMYPSQSIVLLNYDETAAAPQGARDQRDGMLFVITVSAPETFKAIRRCLARVFFVALLQAERVPAGPMFVSALADSTREPALWRAASYNYTDYDAHTFEMHMKLGTKPVSFVVPVQ